MQIEVSIVIVNYNTRDLTLQCLGSIYEQTKDVSFEVIVVDNASTDQSCQVIRERFTQVSLIRSEVNLGFGRANNLGAAKASGRYLLLLNSDTKLVENSVKKLRDFFDSNHDLKIGAIGCKLLNPAGKAAVSHGNFPSVSQELFEFGFSKVFKGYYRSKLSTAIADDSEQVKEVDYVSGACMIFQAARFQEFGGFDKDFFLYFEETELCLRLSRAGYKTIWYPFTSVIHYERASGKSTDKFNYRILEVYYTSKHLYFKKSYGNLIARIVQYIGIPKILRIYRQYDKRRVLKILLRAGKPGLIK